MKNRKFKPWVEYTLITIAMFMFILLVGVNDFDIKDAPILICAWVVLGIIVLALKKYGKRWKEEG